MITQMYNQAQQQGFLSPPKLPDHTLAESDPIAYMEQRAKYDADMQSYQQQQMQMQQLQQQQQKQADEQHQSFVAEQAEIIRGKIPELADPEKSQTHWQSLMNSAKEYGFSDEEIAATADARYIQMANDAMKFRRIVANRKKAEAKSKKAKPVVKAGAKKVADPEGSLKRKQFQKLQKTGRMEDAIDLIAENLALTKCYKPLKGQDKMAQPANTFDSYDQVGIREDLSDIITNITPEATPFFSKCGKTTANNTLVEWQTDTLRNSASNAHILKVTQLLLKRLLQLFVLTTEHKSSKMR